MVLHQVKDAYTWSEVSPVRKYTSIMYNSSVESPDVIEIVQKNCHISPLLHLAEMEYIMQLHETSKCELL